MRVRATLRPLTLAACCAVAACRTGRNYADLDTPRAVAPMPGGFDTSALGMGYVYYPATFHPRNRRDLGNAILTRCG